MAASRSFVAILSLSAEVVVGPRSGAHLNVSRHFDDAALAFETLLCLPSARNGRNLCLQQGHVPEVSERNVNDVGTQPQLESRSAVQPTGNSINSSLSSSKKPSNIFRSASVVAMDARLRSLPKFSSLKNLSISMVVFFSPRLISHASRRGRLTATVRNYRFVFEMACHNSSRSRNNQDERWSVA